MSTGDRRSVSIVELSDRHIEGRFRGCVASAVRVRMLDAESPRGQRSAIFLQSRIWGGKPMTWYYVSFGCALHALHALTFTRVKKNAVRFISRKRLLLLLAVLSAPCLFRRPRFLSNVPSYFGPDGGRRHHAQALLQAGYFSPAVKTPKVEARRSLSFQPTNAHFSHSLATLAPGSVSAERATLDPRATVPAAI